MKQIARNQVDSIDGFLKDKRYLVCDQDSLFTKGIAPVNYGTFLGGIRDCLIQKELKKAGFQKQKNSDFKSILGGLAGVRSRHLETK